MRFVTTGHKTVQSVITRWVEQDANAVSNCVWLSGAIILTPYHLPMPVAFALSVGVLLFVHYSSHHHLPFESILDLVLINSHSLTNSLALYRLAVQWLLALRFFSVDYKRLQLCRSQLSL